MDDAADSITSGHSPAGTAPDSGRLAALRLHLRRGAGLAGAARADWQAAYLEALEPVLSDLGLGIGERTPLRQIAETIRNGAGGTEADPDARWAEEYASESATISYLILTGVSEAEAAQRVARELVARGVPLPTHGGDARGWRRLLEFRDKLRHAQLPETILQTYRQKLEELKRSRLPA